MKNDEGIAPMAMKNDNTISTVFIKNNNGISALLVLIGTLYLLGLLVINPLVLRMVYGVNYNKNVQQEQLGPVQALLGITGVIFIVIGLLGYRFKLLSFLGRSKRRVNLSVIVIMLASGLLLLEYKYRLNPLKRTVEFYDASVPYESSLFSVNRLPQKAVDVPYLDANKKIAYHLNDKGYHGSDFRYVKPKGEIRIVILGGSFVFGDYEDAEFKEEPYNKNWIGKIEEKLHKAGYNNVKIINAGIPGHTSYDCLGRLFSEIHLFDPDYVVLCEAWNDLKYFSKITPKNSLLRLLTPRHIAKREEVEDVFEMSQLYLRMKSLFTRWDRNMEGFLVDKKDSVISEYSKKQYSLTIDLFVQACKSIHAQPILITQPRMTHRNNTKDQLEKIRMDFQSLNYRGVLDGYDYIDSVILNYPRHDAAVLSHHFAKDFVGVDSLFVDHVHLNAKGSDVLSSHLAGYFGGLLNK